MCAKYRLQMTTLSELGNIPIHFSVLKSLYPGHKSVHNKISELEKKGLLIRLKKGMYVVSPQVSGQLLSLELIANHLYGPSYVSMESALSYYGLIPERVYSVKSITTKHARKFENLLGKFEYIRSPKLCFPIGVQQQKKNNRSFLIACPEKALCDLIIHTPNLNLRFQKDLLTYLEYDIRLDMETFYGMDKSIFEQCAMMGRKQSVFLNILKILQQ